MNCQIQGTDYRFYRELQGPTWGYPTEGAYYRDASSSDSLLAVRIPLFAINAEDDPVRTILPSRSFITDSCHQIAVKEAIPYEESKRNPYVVLCTTSLGGHLSWFELGGGRWFAKAVSVPIVVSSGGRADNLGRCISLQDCEGHRLRSDKRPIGF